MPIRLLCPDCRQPLTVADHLSGKRINCPKCKNVVQVPSPEGAPVPGPAPVAPKRPAEEDDLQLNIPGQEHTRHEEKEEYKRCPGCGRDVPDSTVLCTGCGHDFRTGQRRKGFEIVDPERRKRIFDSIVRNGFFLVILIVAVGGIYYAYKKGLFSQKAPPVEEKKEDEPIPTRKPKKKVAAKPAEIKDSLLVVTNDRFKDVTVFADREKIGEVAYRETEKIAIPPPAEGQSVEISFGASLPTGHKLSDAARDAMAKGVLFSGTNKNGLRVSFTGPSPDMVPEPDEILASVLVDLEVAKDPALGVGLISSVKHNGYVIKPVPPQAKLHLAYGKKDKKTVVKWIVQEVLVEQSAKKVYVPSNAPFESTVIDLVVKNGTLDVKE